MPKRMTSLEIVNERINKCLGYLDCNLGVISKEELETIKQDLEVLEIIKNKKVDICYLIHSFKMYEDIEKTLMYYNHECTPQELLTLEELLKLKQWLEKEENKQC